MLHTTSTLDSKEQKKTAKKKEWILLKAILLYSGPDGESLSIFDGHLWEWRQLQ